MWKYRDGDKKDLEKYNKGFKEDKGGVICLPHADFSRFFQIQLSLKVKLYKVR